MDGELANIVYVYTVDGLYIKGTNWKKNYIDIYHFFGDQKVFGSFECFWIFY